MANFNISNSFSNNYPSNYPQNMNGKLTYKVKIKDDYVRTDGTCAIYIQVFLNEKLPKKIPLDFAVQIKDYDKSKQRIKSTHPYYKDFNLLIEKKLADINTIEVNYRLSGNALTLKILLEELDNPTARMDFIKFWENEMINQKLILEGSTYDQQMSLLNKTRKFKECIYFYEITDELINQLKNYCKQKLKNSDNTYYTLLKSFKKYLRLANKKGIKTPLDYKDLKVKSIKGNRTFLTPVEVKLLHEYWSSKFIKVTHRRILSRFLFSCFTGLRISDNIKINDENFIGDFLVFKASKGGKFMRIPLSNSAKNFIVPKIIFEEAFTEKHMNEELKVIAQFLGIAKKISFHVSRHTFATNFLICGGRVEHLQKLLGHSEINETMIYVHIVEDMTNKQIHSMDDILNINI